MTNANKSVWCNNGTEIFEMPYLEYVDLVKKYSEKYSSKRAIDNTIECENFVYSYKGHNYILKFYGISSSLYFCGYVENIPENCTYEPHGDFTGGIENYSGFDCSHVIDFYGLKSPKSSSPERTFKTEEFAHLECQKIIDNVFNINQ